jgi:transcriptional regulator with XRE-family HTH domain
MAKRVVTRFKKAKPGHFIREWRKFRTFTQERLAARVDLSVSSISQLENGEQGYSQPTLEALAEALGCQPGDLLMRNPNDPEAPWGIWETLKPVTKRQAIELLKTLKRTESDERAA